MSHHEIAPGNHDRAWNDPPQLSFNVQNNSQISTSNRLRAMQKKIPVSLNECANSTGSSTVSDAPETSMENGSEKNESNVDDSLKYLEHVEKTFSSLLSFYQMPEKTADDIKKRVSVMSNLWKEGKLHPFVQKEMKFLAIAMEEKNFNKAWSIHQSLIVNYTSDCLSWMIGVKTLITIGRNQL